MNRLLQSSLLAAAVLAWATSAYAADDEKADERAPVAQGEPAPAPAPEAAPAPVAEVKTEVKEEPKADSAVPSRLQPGAVDEKAAEGDKFPVSFSASFGTSAGLGWVAPEVTGSSGYTRQPSLGNSLTLRTGYSIPTFDVLPKMSLSGTLDMSLDWMSTTNSGPVGDRLIRLADFPIGLSFPSLLKEDFTGLSLSPSISVRLPLSVASRFLNRFGSVGVGLPIAWNYEELPWSLGSVGVTYTPAIRLNGYTKPSATMPCGTPIPIESSSPGLSPLNGIDEAPTGSFREEQYLADGTCVVSGRQTLASVSNSAGVSWSKDEHAVSLSIAHTLGYKRPVADTFHSPNAAPGILNDIADELSAGVSYSYAIPLDIAPHLSVEAGLDSKPGYNMMGYQRIPLLDVFDLHTWNYNTTQAYVSLAAEI